MKKLFVCCIALILLLLSACASQEHIDEESMIIGRAVDEDYELSIMDGSGIYGWSQDKGLLCRSALTSMPNFEKGDIYELYPQMSGYELGCLASLDKIAKIHHVQRVSSSKLYTVHILSTGINEAIFVYVFFQYDIFEGCWRKTGEICEVSSEGVTKKSDYDGIQIGSSLSDVTKIDGSQYMVFFFKRELDKEIVTNHITREGLLKITYERDEAKASLEAYVVKTLEWSDPLPILEQDLPK
ncbi:MAG: hypothetical protein IKK58_06135 [Clostridia bacterium]|nr:hypothetical protein [Clostridia bacterium]